MRLKDRVAIITGAGSDFGAAMTRRFSKEDARILAGDWNQDAVEKLADELSGEGRDVRAQRVDVSKSSEVAQLAKAALEAFGQIDFLINNAGISPKKAYLDYTEADWDPSRA